MTVHSFWQQALVENAATTRKLSQLMWTGADGVRYETGSPLLVQAQVTPNMTVKVNSGWAKKSGYLAHNDALIAALTIPTADPFLPRKDYVVVRWYDTESGDGTALAQIEVLTGTPNASPSPPSLTGKTVQVLALVDVAAATTSIAGSAITDQRSLVTQASRVLWQASLSGNNLTSDSSDWRKVTLNTIEVDTAGIGLSSGGFKCPTTGLYRVSGQAAFPGTDTDGKRAVGVVTNPASPPTPVPAQSSLQPPMSTGSTFMPTPTRLVQANKGDILNLIVFQDSGSTLTMIVQSLTVELVSA